jgi:hypothetical protein
MKVPKDHRRLDIGTSVHDNPGFQLEHYHVLVAKLTHLAAAIPLPTRLLHLFPQLHLGKPTWTTTRGEHAVMLISHWDR